MPRFSIIITCYNQKALISEAVDSALSQAYPDKEVIVVDDGSTDGSREVLGGYSGAIKYKPLEKNQGAGAARNSGASLASGDYLVFLDGDDLLFPWALEVYARAVDLKHPKLMLGCMVSFQDHYSTINLQSIRKEIEIVEYAAFLKKDRTWQASASATIVDRQAYLDVGGYSRDFFPIEDVDLVLRLGCSGRTVQILSPRTTAYRMHGSNTTSPSPKMIASALGLVQRERTGVYPGGPNCRWDRYGIIGGIALFWMRWSLRAKMHGKALKIFIGGWPMILAAVSRRLSSRLKGQSQVEHLGTATYSPLAVAVGESAGKN